MMSWTNIFYLFNLFWCNCRIVFLAFTSKSANTKVSIDRESKKLEQLRKMREISLTEPLAEKVRPTSFLDIVGQEDGIKSLKAALCGPNPQHVIIYGPRCRKDSGSTSRIRRSETKSKISISHKCNIY